MFNFFIWTWTTAPALPTAKVPFCLKSKLPPITRGLTSTLDTVGVSLYSILEDSLGLVSKMTPITEGYQSTITSHGVGLLTEIKPSCP